MLNQLYRDGFYVTSIPREEADRLFEEVAAETFHADEPGSPDIAAWEADNPSLNMNVPPLYLGFMEQLGLSLTTAHLRAQMGDWSRTNVMLQRGKKGDSMRWHHDYYDPMHLICLLYLGDNDWTPADGGMIEFGEGEIDETGLIQAETVRIKASVSPNHGTLIWAINTNPRWVHRITEIKSEKSRYTMIGQFGFRENVLRTRIAKHYGVS